MRTLGYIFTWAVFCSFFIAGVKLFFNEIGFNIYDQKWYIGVMITIVIAIPFNLFTILVETRAKRGEYV